jgi:hypothetical protein
MPTNAAKHIITASDMIDQADALLTGESGQPRTPQSATNLANAQMLYIGATAHIAMAEALGYF